MDKVKQDKIICLDEEGEELGDSSSSEMEEEENEVDKPSINKSSNQPQPGSSNKNGTNGSADPKKPQKKQRSTNKVSIEELSKQIKQNQQKRQNGLEDGVVIKASFDWVNYDTNEDKTLNYISDFLKSNDGNSLDYQRLDLVEFEDVNIVQHHSQVSSITDDLYKRILRYGQIENIQRISKKSGAISKGDTTAVNFRDELYYDQNDPFIDDDEEYAAHTKGGYQQRMQLAEVFIDDFRTFDGDLKDFVKCEIYKNRVEIMQSLEKKNQIQEETENQNKKKKKPITSSSSNPNATIAGVGPSAQGPSSSNNLTTNKPDSLASVIHQATATLNSKIQKKSDIEKDLNQADVKTQDKKKVKKDTGTSSASAQHLQNSSLLAGQLTQSAAVQNQQNQAAAAAANAAQNLAAANMLFGGSDLTSNQQLSQLLSQAQPNNSLLQNAQQAFSLDYLKQTQSALGGSQFVMQPYYNQGLVFPYMDTTQSQLLMDLNNMMLFPPQQQNNQTASNFMFPQQAYNLNSNTQAQANSNLGKAQQHDNKDKKKKKKPIGNTINNGTSLLNKDNLNNKGKPQQMNLIEIEDDDDPSQNTQTNQSTKTGMDSEK